MSIKVKHFLSYFKCFKRKFFETVILDRNLIIYCLKEAQIFEGFISFMHTILFCPNLCTSKKIQKVVNYLINWLVFFSRPFFRARKNRP